jgi:hypothetical protein
MQFIQSNAEQTVRGMLKEFAGKHGTKISALDHMDDGSPIKLAIEIDPNTGSAVFDFTGTGPQVYANHNAPPAVTYSAVIYSLRSLVAQTIPLNQGCLAPITFIIPEYSLLNPSADAGVVGGNVLTSQRVVDVVLKAFSACAASQGCMNNLTFGDKEFGYYETIAGGAGAGPTWDGRSGIHTHCTNTRVRVIFLIFSFWFAEMKGGIFLTLTAPFLLLFLSSSDHGPRDSGTAIPSAVARILVAQRQWWQGKASRWRWCYSRIGAAPTSYCQHSQ